MTVYFYFARTLATSSGSLIVLEPYGSIKSLSASHDVACFPTDPRSPGPSPQPQRKSLPSSPLLSSSRFRTLSLNVSNLPKDSSGQPISYHIALSPIQSSRSISPLRLQSAPLPTLPSIRVSTPEIVYVTPIHTGIEEEEERKSSSAKY
uniref:Uncharacterized protein n=1 Tax=Cacopsylla melanoneura TaxID=428564 RepID=A0A8D8TKB5_9HEMI